MQYEVGEWVDAYGRNVGVLAQVPGDRELRCWIAALMAAVAVEVIPGFHAGLGHVGVVAQVELSVEATLDPVHIRRFAAP